MNDSLLEMPTLTSEALSRTETLTHLIRQEIDMAGGYISFAEFMQMALYQPNLGYYAFADFTIGKKGDFTTACEISPLFAKSIVKQVIQIAELLSTSNILEIGAGSGRFAMDLLLDLEKQGYLPGYYYIYEISEGLRAKQQAFFRTECPDLIHRIVWLDELPENFSGVIIANEVLDAIPTHCFRVENQRILERCITWKNDAFCWEIRQPISIPFQEKTQELIKQYYLPDGYESEINLNSSRFIKSLATCLAQGIILFLDYGYGQKEYYHPGRYRGTLTCFYQHKKHHDPLILPGLQDITAHVDFTHVIETAADYCELKGYTNQVSFLLACGLTELVTAEETNLSALEQIKLHQAVKMLTMPTEMGEVSKVMALGKRVEIPLLGFELSDRRRDL